MRKSQETRTILLKGQNMPGCYAFSIQEMWNVWFHKSKEMCTV